MLNSLLERLERSWTRLVWGAVLGTVVAIGLSFALPWQYSSTMRLLVVQANVAGLDPYTAIKSTEQIAGSLRELVYTSLVASPVLTQTQGLDAAYFPQEERARRKLWEKTVEVAVVPGSGILGVTAYHPDREQARLLVEAVSRQVMGQAPNFGYNAQVRVIDTPLPSRWYARPDLLKNGGYGAAVGCLLAAAWLFVGLEKRSK